MKSQWQGQLNPGPDSCGGKLTPPPFDRSSRPYVFGLTREMLWVEGPYLHHPMALYGFHLAGAQPAGPPLVPQAQPAILPSTPDIHLYSNAWKLFDAQMPVMCASSFGTMVAMTRITFATLTVGA